MPQNAVFLLVEDSADDVLLVRRAFLKANILNPLRIVRSGEEAIEYLKGEGRFADRNEFPLPSVILLDLKLPGKDGFEVMQWLSHHPTLSKLTVIVLTHSDSVYDLGRAYKLGARSFLMKPVLFERLAEMMQAVKGHWVWHAEPPELSEPLASNVESHKPRLEQLGQGQALTA